MKSILISIKPKYVAEILKGRKTIEIRKSKPKRNLPINVYIYCTKDNESIGKIKNMDTSRGKVVAMFSLTQVKEIKNNFGTHFFENETEQKSCLKSEELFNYLHNKRGYAWHIDNLKIFDKPKKLHEFKLNNPPQSWQFVESEELANG